MQVSTKLRGGELQRRLAGATDAGAVLMLVEENSGEFDAIHACTALHRVSKLTAATSSGGRLPLANDPRFIKICELLLTNFNKMDAQGASYLLSKIAKKLSLYFKILCIIIFASIN